MMERARKHNVLRNIPEVGLKNVFEDEIIYQNISKDDVNFTKIEVMLKHFSGVKLVGALRWSDLSNNNDLTYIKKLLEESTDELKTISKSFTASNGMKCTVTLDFFSEGTILESIETKNRFVLKDINIVFESKDGTEKLLNTKDCNLLKSAIEEVKIELDRKSELLAKEVNKYSGEKAIMSAIKVS